MGIEKTIFGQNAFSKSCFPWSMLPEKPRHTSGFHKKVFMKRPNVYWWGLGRKHSQMTLKARIHPPTPPKHPWKLKKHPQAPQTHPMTPRNSFDYSKTLVRHSERHLGCQGMSGRTLGEMRVSDHVCCMSGMLVSVWGCYGYVLGYVRGGFGVSGDIWGCLGVLEGVRGARGGVW